MNINKKTISKWWMWCSYALLVISVITGVYIIKSNDKIELIFFIVIMMLGHAMFARAANMNEIELKKSKVYTKICMPFNTWLAISHLIVLFFTILIYGYHKIPFAQFF